MRNAGMPASNVTKDRAVTSGGRRVEGVVGRMGIRHPDQLVDWRSKYSTHLRTAE